MSRSGRPAGWTYPRRFRCRTALALLLAGLALGLVGCRRSRGATAPVDVLYAGSLTATMEEALGPAFRRETGRAYLGEGRGSLAGAHLIREGVRRPDLYVTADPGTLNRLGDRDPGWAVIFASSELAIGYSPRSAFASALDSAAAGRIPWTSVVTRPGFRLGRTDPELDPKGYRTLWMFRLAASETGDSALDRRLLAASPAGEAVFPEEHLAARVEVGQLDAGVFYRAEARAEGLSVLRLPGAVNLGDPAYVARYRELRYRTPEGRTLRGGMIRYAATVPASAPDPGAGLEMLRFLLSSEADSILEVRGFRPLSIAIGDTSRMPATLRGIHGREVPNES